MFCLSMYSAIRQHAHLEAVRQGNANPEIFFGRAGHADHSWAEQSAGGVKRKPRPVACRAGKARSEREAPSEDAATMVMVLAVDAAVL